MDAITLQQAKADAAKRYLRAKDGPNVGRGLATVQTKSALMNAGTIARIRFMTYGDSYAQKVFAQMIGDQVTGLQGPLARMFGTVAGAYGRSGANNAYASVNAPTGTVTAHTTDFDASPDGITYTVTAGNTATFSVGKADTVKVYLINEPGAGTCKVQIDGVDLTGYTSINLGGTLGTLTIVPATGLTIGTAHTLAVVGLTGSSRILMAGFENTTISGVVPINVSQGGIALNSPTTTAWANWTAVLADLQPDVMTYECKEASSYFAAALQTFFTATKAGAPRMGVIGIGSPPVINDPTSDQALQNAQLKAACATFGYIYYDTYRLFQVGDLPNGVADYANLDSIGASTFTATTTSGSPNLTAVTPAAGNPFPIVGSTFTATGIPSSTSVVSVNAAAKTLVMSNNATASGTVTIVGGGWGGGGVHVTLQADQYRARALMQDLFIPTAYGRPNPFDVAAQEVTATRRLAFGITPTSPVLELLADTGTDLDVYAYLKRALRFRAPGSSTDLFLFDTRNTGGNPSAIPANTQVGPGQAGFVGTSTDMVSVRRWNGSNMNNLGDFSARTFIPLIVSASVSGTYVVPVLTGTVFRLTPSANGTVISAANGITVADGQEIEIQIIRGATAFTYSLDSHFQFAGGVAPTVGTAINTRDIYRFRYSSNWKVSSPPQIEVP